MKICGKCNKETQFENLIKDKTRKDGYKPLCKQCDSARKKLKYGNSNYPILEINKICNICKIDKSFKNFHKDKTDSTGTYSICKQCRVSSSASYYQKNTEVIKIKTADYYKENKKDLYQTSRKRNKVRFKEDKFYALTRRLRNRLWYALQKKSWKKNTKFSQYIGCTQEELVSHIEKQFQPGMTWEDRKAWHIDHIIPLSSALTEDHMYSLCHYTNLQPMWAKDNIKKGAKVA